MCSGGPACRDGGQASPRGRSQAPPPGLGPGHETATRPWPLRRSNRERARRPRRLALPSDLSRETPPGGRQEGVSRTDGRPDRTSAVATALATPLPRSPHRGLPASPGRAQADPCLVAATRLPRPPDGRGANPASRIQAACRDGAAQSPYGGSATAPVAALPHPPGIAQGATDRPSDAQGRAGRPPGRYQGKEHPPPEGSLRRPAGRPWPIPISLLQQHHGHEPYACVSPLGMRAV